MKHTIVILFVSLMMTLQAGAQNGYESFTHGWADDPIWFDGKAEYVTYEATRPIYGKLRQYQALIITNKEHFSTKTFTKDATRNGMPVFKHHILEDIAVKNYVYHYSMMSYIGTKDFKSYKLDHASIEDCGSTYKRFVNWDGKVSWEQDSYFPNEGSRNDRYNTPKDFGFFDAMTLVLRGYPFDAPADIMMNLVPDQSTTKWSPYAPQQWVVEYVGKEKLILPIGEVEAYHVRMRFAGPTKQFIPPVDFWFEASTDRQHVLVQYTGPHGVNYKIKSYKRFAYWEGN
ncbi:hypothetical protein [Poriferisphaera sp. WC338]|uniref:hypothetical protein n=1 Tax=Poriferisphaera sp. WC338 TaxID=3425129 RepID=UPI003D81313D